MTAVDWVTTGEVATEVRFDGPEAVVALLVEGEPVVVLSPYRALRLARDLTTTANAAP